MLKKFLTSGVLSSDDLKEKIHIWNTAYAPGGAKDAGGEWVITPAAPKPTLNAPSQEIEEIEKAYEEVLGGNLAEVLARKKWLHMGDVDALYHPKQLEIATLQCG